MQFAWFRKMLPHAHIIESSIISFHIEALRANTKKVQGHKTAAAETVIPVLLEQLELIRRIIA